jgi:hypothetical protein
MQIAKDRPAAALQNTGNVVDRPRDLPDDIAAMFRTTGFCE